MSTTEPIVRVLSDAYVTIQFSERLDLADNLLVHRVARALGDASPTGVVEIVPSLNSLGVVFDRRRTTPAATADAVRAALEEAGDVTELPSRIFRIPVWYDDPWSSRIAEIYDVEHNLALVARENGCTPREAIDRHTGSEFWVTAVGFVPGCFWTVPLDASLGLSAPKYRTPRDRTPARAVGLAGLTTTIYPYPGPGGYQCIGRSAVEVYALGSADPLFPEDGVLVRPGDRHQYVAVDPFEYEEIRERVSAGSYEYDVTDGVFDISTWSSAGSAAPASSLEEIA